MSSLWLSLAMVGTFLAVLAGVFAVATLLSERRRPVTMLETQMGIATADHREQQLDTSFVERVVVPFGMRLGGLLRRLLPIDAKRIERKLVLAGNPVGWDPEKVAAFKAVGGLAGLVFGLMLALTLGWGGPARIALIAVPAVIFFLMPSAYISQRAVNRQTELQRALPDTMDLLTISVEAGLGFDAALAQVTRNVPGALSEEVARTLQEMQIGVSRVDAFRHLAERTDVEELNAFVLAMIQADMFGVSVAKVLRAQARELRQKRRQRAERMAMKVPVKIVFPMIFCILPAIFVVVLGPAVIRFFEDFVR